jgi:hypothetical protein
MPGKAAAFNRESGGMPQEAINRKSLSQPLSPPLSDRPFLDKGGDEAGVHGSQLSRFQHPLGFRISLRLGRVESTMDSIPEPRNTPNTRNLQAHRAALLRVFCVFRGCLWLTLVLAALD